MTCGYRVSRRARPLLKGSFCDAAGDERAWKTFVRKVPRGNENGRRARAARNAGGVVASHELFGRLLLRGRSALPSLGVCASCSGRARRGRRRAEWTSTAARAYLLQRPEAVEDFPFGPDAYVYKIRGRMFALW
jgi:hypothetical protein